MSFQRLKGGNFESCVPQLSHMLKGLKEVSWCCGRFLSKILIILQIVLGVDYVQATNETVFYDHKVTNNKLIIYFKARPHVGATNKGVGRWPGKQIHSHNYRVPEPFRNKIVVLIGSSASAVDISREIASVAKEVHIASWSNSNEESASLPGYDNIWLRPMIESANEDGTISFPHDFKISADIILHCTGYTYHFPFLDVKGIVTVDDNRVGPLYKHVFPPSLAPWLSFVGLPWKIAPFPQFELQSAWIAGILSGRISLPSQEEMMKDVETFYDSLQASGMPKRYTHNLTGYQFEYNDWIAAQCGIPKTEEWRKKIYHATSLSRRARPENYRDEWEDEGLVLQAYEDFAKQIACKQAS